MRTLLFVLLLLAALPATAQDESAAVEQLARDALTAISDRDSTAFMALMAPGARVYSISGGDIRTRDALTDADGLAKATQSYLERMWDPVVHVDDNLAVVWTRYDFWVDGTFSHCGTDTFQMMKTPEGWRILTVAYNVTRDCPPSPLGDPTF